MAEWLKAIVDRLRSGFYCPVVLISRLFDPKVRILLSLLKEDTAMCLFFCFQLWYSRRTKFEESIMKLMCLKKDYKLLLFNKVEFINKLHAETGASIMLCSELFFTLFKDKKEFTVQELDDIIETYPQRLLYFNKILFVVENAN